MKKSFRVKYPYIAAILIAFLCTFMTALGSAIPQIMGFDVDMQLVVTTIILVFSVFIGLIIIKNTNIKFSDYGFRKNLKNSYRKVWFYIPLVLIEIIPIALSGFSSKVTTIQYITLLFFTVVVGFNEEMFFRGIVFNFLLAKSRKVAIIVSSVIFGILHLANAFNGENSFYLILQVIFAFLVGIVLAEIVSITKSLWLVILWHASHDYIANITGDSLDSKALIGLALQVIILLIYAICIWKSSLGEKLVEVKV